MDLALEASDHDGVTVVAARGELDLGSAPRLRDLAIRRLTDGDRHLVIDLSGVEFLDSTGLGTLVAVLKRARTLGGDVGLVVARERMRKIFEITNLDASFAIAETLDGAVATARRAGAGG